jgi:hypothetical protein
MRTRVGLAIISLFLWGGKQTQTDRSVAPSDPYSIDFVNSALQFFTSKEGHFGGEVKNFLYLTPSLPQLGDGVSIAILKIVDPEDLSKPNIAYAYLEMVALAFSDRSKIVQEADRNPKVTIFVLNYLQEKELAEPKLEKRINTIKACIRDYNCNPSSLDATR